MFNSVVCVMYDLENIQLIKLKILEIFNSLLIILSSMYWSKEKKSKRPLHSIKLVTKEKHIFNVLLEILFTFSWKESLKVWNKKNYLGNLISCSHRKKSFCYKNIKM